MKKVVVALLCILIVMLSFAPCAVAYQSEREYFEDGSYMIVSDDFIGNDFENGYEGDEDHISGDGQVSPEGTESGIGKLLKTVIEFIKKIISLLKTNKSVKETKYLSYYSSQGKLLWTATLTAEFTYNGKTSVCDSVKTGYMIYDSDWKVISEECEKSGDTAIGHFSVRQYKLAVPLKTIEKSITLTCDKDGNIK